MTRGLEVSRSELVAKGYTNVRGVWCPPATYELPTPITTTARFGTAPNGRAFKSKWEAEYAAQLDLEVRTQIITAWDYEGMKLWIGDGAYYTPDFVVWDHLGRLEWREIKGHWREAARVRVKVCAARFRQVPIKIVSKQGGRFVTLETFNA